MTLDFQKLSKNSNSGFAKLQNERLGISITYYKVYDVFSALSSRLDYGITEWWNTGMVVLKKDIFHFKVNLRH